MRLLLDTHTLLWWLTDDKRLSDTHYRLIGNPIHSVYVSAATSWEIFIKKSLGKITAPDNLEQVIADNRFIPLPITIRHTAITATLPLIHKDPFDRILVAQAIVDGLSIITVDPEIKKYDVTAV